MTRERPIMLVTLLLLILGCVIQEKLSGNAWLLGMLLVFGGFGLVALLIRNFSSEGR